MQTILDHFYTPHVLATALLHYFASDKRTDLTQSKKTVLALHALASERRQVRITAGHISLSESLVLPVESVDDEAMQHLQELAAHLVHSTTFSVQDDLCNAGFAFPHDDGASAPPILGTELVLTAFWVMLDDAMRQHKKVYRTGYFDVVLQGMLHKSRVQVSPLLASLAVYGYQALSA